VTGMLAYRFALNPGPAQQWALRSHAGAARVAFNWGLTRVKAVMDQRAAEATYRIAGDDLTPSISWSLYSLRKDWNQAKATVAPWWAECSKEAFNTGLDQLARALKNWGDSRKGKRRGKPAGFPRFRSRRRAHLSVRFTTGAFRCEDRHAVLPRIGRVKLHENASRLTSLVSAGTARVLSVSVRFERGRWFAAFTVEQDVSRPPAAVPGAVIGADLGIKTLAVLSTGEEIPNPRHLGKSLRKVRRLSRTMSRRRGPDRRTRQQPSNRWRRASAALGKAQGRVADQRRDALHKTTSSLTARFGTIAIEDLHVRGMLANRRLARQVADASFAEFRRQVEYKTAWRGGRVIVADRWFASSKTCSGCGAVKAKLALSERTYVCTSCGAVADRDLNAARNLAEYGKREVAGSGPETVNGRGADRKTGPARQVAVKRQSGIANASQTGTVPLQGGTAV
jgi:IS605 OrfB family transposase